MNELIFPDKNDPNYGKKLVSLKEYQIYKVPELDEIESEKDFDDKSKDYCTGLEKTQYQHLMQHYLSRRSPYRSLLLYHGLGVGKTCSAITIAESLLLDHTYNDEPRVIVISSEALKKSFIDQLFDTSRLMNNQNLEDQCTGDLYRNLVHVNDNNEVIAKKILKVIRHRYQFITYDGLKNIAKTGKKWKNKIIIIDEVHNLRQNDKQKDTARALENLIEAGEANRLIMLTATPMYNDPEEIMWLLKMLVLNEEKKRIEEKRLYRKDDKGKTIEQQLFQANITILKDLSSKYISYIRGSNPFTFAARLNPQVNGIDIIKKPWVKNITDGLVPTVAGSKQIVKEYKKLSEADINDEEIDENNKSGISVALQLLNITYPNSKHGEDGFNEMFNQIDESEPIQVSYRKPEYSLYGENLKECAAKIHRIVELIKDSEGPIIVFSQFVMSGAVPLAIALEHLGFSRYGARNLLNKRDVKEKTTFPNVPFPKYSIFTGSRRIMGSSKIDQIIKTTNQRDNMHGEKVKVVIITPIGGEGLNFKNIREVHIMDPWYHMNRIDQVIGRGIRTCSHINLPLEERNVTVYLHVAVKSINDETSADIHAYKIAAKKLDKTRYIEKTIRDSALDCSLLKNVNYYPKTLFKFVATMRTSQKNTITYNFGDDSMYEPNCINKIDQTKSKDFTMREEVLLNMMPTLLKKLKKYILKELPKVYFTPDEIAINLKLDKEIVYYTLKNALYPNELIKGYRIYPHLGKIVVVKDNEEVIPRKLKITEEIREEEIELNDESEKAEESKETENTDCDIIDIITRNRININGDNKLATINLYQGIDSKCWPIIAKKLIKDSINNSQLGTIANLLWKEGALIKSKEIDGNDETYIGYCDIFKIGSFDVYILNSDGSYREAKPKQLESIIKNRKEKKLTGNYGIIAPKQPAKDKFAAFNNIFKISGVGSGTVCETKQSPALKALLASLNPNNQRLLESSNKSELCQALAYEMLKQDKLLFYPIYKP